MKYMSSVFLTLLAVMALGACTYDKHSEIRALNEAQAAGSPFTQNLAEEYRAFANRELHEMQDYPDSLHFARKGLAAASGTVVLPEPLSDWNLLPRHMEELGAARIRMMQAFDMGAREIDPANSAIAQARFDCWIEQQEENWQDTDFGGCRSGFMNAIAALEGALSEMAPPPAAELDVPEPVQQTAPPAEPMAPEDAMYLVFFDWDESSLGSGAMDVLDAVAEEFRNRTGTFETMQIVGHADTSGPEAYNRKLAMRRAESTRDALVNRGIPPSMISIESRGENDLLVETDDNVREPANRRANISFE